MDEIITDGYCRENSTPLRVGAPIIGKITSSIPFKWVYFYAGFAWIVSEAG